MLKDYEADMLGCSRCSLCKWVALNQIKSWRFAQVCPAIAKYNFHAYSGGGKMVIGLSLLQGRSTWTDEAVKAVYRCTLCGACDTMCKVYRDDIDVLDAIEELRVKCVEDGKGPMPEHKRFAGSIEKNFNPYHESHEDRFKWMPKGVKPAEKADVAYFVGCTSAYRRREIAQATVKILAASKTDFMILGPDEWCCGSPLLRTGQVELAKKMMEHNVKVFNDLGVKEVITSCAGCYETLKVDYSRYGFEKNFEVKHSSEYINQLIKEGKLELKEVPMKVTYHDPCHLGRRADPWVGAWNGNKLLRPESYIRRGRKGLYEPPREILRNIPGVDLVEMERIKEYAWCCGSGGGVKSAFGDFAIWTAKERIEEAKATGAQSIVTTCPFCVRNLDDAVKEMGDGTEVMDLTTLVLKAIGG